jgi:hypothetical protein
LLTKNKEGWQSGYCKRLLISGRETDPWVRIPYLPLKLKYTNMNEDFSNHLDSIGNQIMSSNFYVGVHKNNGINYPILYFCTELSFSEPRFGRGEPKIKVLRVDRRSVVKRSSIALLNTITKVYEKDLVNCELYKKIVEDKRYKEYITKEKWKLLDE